MSKQKNMTTKFNSLLQVLDFFKDEDTCKSYIAKSRWGDTPSCPHCGTVGAYTTTRGYKCKSKECHQKFSVTTGTIFENTKAPLRVWFAAMYLCTAHKKGISSLQLHRDLHITQKTAWFLLHRIREMLANNSAEKLEGVVEVDETYVGGKNKNRHVNKKVENSQGRGGSDKTAVLGIAQKQIVEYITRDHKVIPGKKVIEKIIKQPSKVSIQVISNTEADTLQPIMVYNVKAGSKVVTDAYRSYIGLNKHFSHVAIKHTEGNYITIGEDHTNTIEGFWSLLDRGIVGIYHNVSAKHLHRYCHEFEERYNTRLVTDTDRFFNTFVKSNNIRLTYKKLIGKNGKEQTSAETQATEV